MAQELIEFRPQVYTMLPANMTDERPVELWLHDLAVTTQKSYCIDIRAFFAFVQKPLRAINLGDLQQFADDLKTRGYKEATIARRLRAGIETYNDTIKRGRRAGEIVTRSRVSPHWLRHAHGSHAIARGADLALVRDTLGHASIETTGRYVHARPNTSSSLFLPDVEQ